MFNPKTDELLEIKPVEDIVCPTEEERPATPPPTHEEIFEGKKETKDVVLNVKEIEEEKPKPELNGWGKEKKHLQRSSWRTWLKCASRLHRKGQQLL